MKKHHEIDALLRSMDVANEHPHPDVNRSQHDLHQILQTHLAEAEKTSVGAEHKTVKTKPQHRRRFALGALALATTAGFLIVPALSGGDPAFATWTATPIELSHTERSTAVSNCLRSSQDVGDGMYANDVATAEVAIAEKRGAWTTIVLTSSDGFEATCTTDETAPWFRKGSFGSVGKPGNGIPLTSRAVRATQLGTGTIANNNLSIATGQVGPDVTSITYTSTAGEKIIATVSKGQFAFWLPGTELTNDSDQNVPIEVTYQDNTTETQYLTL